MRIIRALWKRLSLFQRIGAVIALLIAAFLFGGSPLIGTLPCAQTARSPAGQISQCITSIRQQVTAVRAAFCDAEGNCSSDTDAPPSDVLDQLQATLNALPLGWAQPGLFAQPTRLEIAAGDAVILVFDPVAGDTSVSVGRILLEQGARLTLTSEVSIDRAQDSFAQTCSVELRRTGGVDRDRIQPETRLALAAAARTALTLDCPIEAGNCTVLLDNASANLARDSECEGE